MEIKTFKIKQYCAPTKVVICIDGKPFVIAKSNTEASKIISVINGAENVILVDGTVKRQIARLQGKDEV